MLFQGEGSIMNILAVNLAGVLVIVLVIWWFWLSEPKAQRVLKNVVDILVEGGPYSPARIEVEVGNEVTLRFLRRDKARAQRKSYLSALESVPICRSIFPKRFLLHQPSLESIRLPARCRCTGAAWSRSRGCCADDYGARRLSSFGR